MINVDELFEKRYGGKTALQYFEENESFTPIEMVNFAKHCIEQLNKPAVMQAEVSDGVSGAAVGNSAAGQSGSDGVMKWCDSCGKITKWIDGDCENYKTRGGSAKGALPR